MHCPRNSNALRNVNIMRIQLSFFAFDSISLLLTRESCFFEMRRLGEIESVTRLTGSISRQSTTKSAA